MNLKEMVNGARLPNWVWLLAGGIMIGVNVASHFFGTQASIKAVENTGDKQITVVAQGQRDIVYELRRVAERDSTLIISLSDKVDRRTKQINAELKVISTKTGIILREVE